VDVVGSGAGASIRSAFRYVALRAVDDF